MDRIDHAHHHSHFANPLAGDIQFCAGDHDQRHQRRADAESSQLVRAEVSDDGRVDEQVQRFRGQHHERRRREAEQPPSGDVSSRGHPGNPAGCGSRHPAGSPARVPARAEAVSVIRGSATRRGEVGA